MNKTILFCLAHAGGNIGIYRPLEKYLSDEIKTIFLEIPGRGLRVNEELIYDLEKLTEDVFSQIKKVLENKKETPYIILGHSLGAILAYNATQYIQKQKLFNLPSLLCLSSPAFVSAKSWQNILSTHKTSDFQKKELLFDNEAKVSQFLSDLDGSPNELLDNKDFLNYIKPILSADFCALYSWCPQTLPLLNCPIHVFWGKEEKDMGAHRWASKTNKSFKMTSFEGGHFHILNNLEKVSSCILKSYHEHM